MKRFNSLLWAAVAVLGLYSPVFSYAGSPFGNFSSKGATVRSGGSSNSSGGNSLKSMPYGGGNGSVFKSQVLKTGGLNTQVKKTPVVNQNLGGKLGTKVGPIISMPGNGKPPINKTPIVKPFPGNIGTVLDPGFGKGPKRPPILNPFPGGNGPILDPGNGGGKPPKKPPILDPFPGGGIPPILDPGGGKPPKKPPFDPFPGGGIPPSLDPGNGGGGNGGGGNNPPGGGNNPPGGGNGGGNGNGGGHGHGHGHHHHWWPNYCLDWYCPPFYTQPYCGTVYLNGSWTYVTQPVAVEQISLVQAGDGLPEIPSAATFKMQVSGLAAAKGMAAVEVNGVGMQAELLEWNGDSVVVRLPSVGLTQPLVSQLYILQPDGSMAKNLKFKMLPAAQNAVAAN